jgi:BirA family biotin operon repressor/biotin-[acetyl-CoA-carboxylase] ligase
MAEPAASQRARPGGGPDWQIRHLASVDSTNRATLDAARAGAAEGLVMVADHQTAGRGRLGRTWEAAPGSALLVSVLLRPALAPDRLAWTTMAAALALADAVEAVGGVAARLKWPNDLVVGDRKLAGVLAEADVVGGTVRAVVVGVGCNLAATAIPTGLADAATSVETETGRVPERDDVLAAFLDALDRALVDVGRVPAAVRTRSATIGRRVRVELGVRQAVEGTAVDVTDAGELLVRDVGGTIHTIAVGDVHHLRPLR